jgi:hypothetical protein
MLGIGYHSFSCWFSSRVFGEVWGWFWLEFGVGFLEVAFVEAGYSDAYGGESVAGGVGGEFAHGEALAWGAFAGAVGAPWVVLPVSGEAVMLVGVGVLVG